jgi:hypothetical protein
VRCLYHSDCQSNYCLKLDTIDHSDLEGFCATYQITEGCSSTVVDIGKEPRAQSDIGFSKNRCEFIPCMFDNECMDWAFCLENRQCSTTYRPKCNQSEVYGMRDYTGSGSSKYVSSINRCLGVKCKSDSDCNADSPYCSQTQGICKEYADLFIALKYIIIITGVVSLLIGMVIGYLLTKCSIR